MRLQRDCLELAEVVEDWEVTEAEIRHLVATGALKLSVRLVGQRVTLLAQQGGGSAEPCWVPSGNKVVNTVADLAQPDAFGLVRDGQRVVREVSLSETMRAILCDADGVSFSQRDALVRLEHVATIEREVLDGQAARGREAFDFRGFVYGGEAYAFTWQQSRALDYMLAATRAGAPDQHYLAILKAAGSVSPRLGSLFSRKPGWTRLLRRTDGRRGWYYLDPAFVVWLSRSS